MPQPSSTSTIAAARAALYALLLAEAPDRTHNAAGQLAKPIQVAFGPPPTEEMEVVAILGVRNNDEDVEALGAQRREETYEIEVGIKVQDPAAGAGSEAAMAVDARGFELADWVRGVVHRHWTLNGTVRVAAVTRQITDGVQLVDRGCLIFLLLSIECTSSLITAGAAP